MSLTAALPTPLGALAVEAALRAPLRPATATEDRAGAAPGARHLRWDDVDASVRLDVVPFALPDHLRDRPTIAASWVVVLRAVAHRAVPAVRLSCTWGPDAQWDTNEGPETGELVVAYRWSGGAVTLSLRTSDLESLQGAAARGYPLPARWGDDLGRVAPDGGGLLIVDHTGIIIDAPALLPREAAQLHLLAAWGPRDADDAGTWLAVGATPQEVADGLGAIP